MASEAEMIDLTTLPPIDCPCGIARRAFADRPEFPGTVHLTDISRDAREHFHQTHTEVYVILSCSPGAVIELDGIPHKVKPLTAVLIPPGVRHRAVGEMRTLIICNPNFDPTDEIF
ncbi:cupin domain-containing protein [bacterium]|nr:cupin domain-containing protein [bacterium]